MSKNGKHGQDSVTTPEERIQNLEEGCCIKIFNLSGEQGEREAKVTAVESPGEKKFKLHLSEVRRREPGTKDWKNVFNNEGCLLELNFNEHYSVFLKKRNNIFEFLFPGLFLVAFFPKEVKEEIAQSA